MNIRSVCRKMPSRNVEESFKNFLYPHPKTDMGARRHEQGALPPLEML